MAIVGIIPAAGHGTRLQPLPCSKEVVPLAGRPVMDYLVERMRRGGARELRLVTRPDKDDVLAHAERLGIAVRTGRPATVSQSLAIALEGLDPDDVVLVGFPDTVWEPADGFRRLVRALTPNADVVVGLFRTGEPERCDVVTLDEKGWLTGVEIKSPRPSSDWIWACAAARARALDGLEAVAEPGLRFDELARRRRVLGVRLSERFFDVGTRRGLAEAEEALGGKRQPSQSSPSTAP